MKLLFNTCLPEQHFGIEKSIEILADAGFDAIDFSFCDNDDKFCSSETDTPEFEARMRALRELAKKKGVTFTQAHAPFPSSTSSPVETKEIFENIVRSMKYASILGVEIIVVHPMQHLDYAEEGNPEKLFEMNIDFYNRLLPYCKKYNIKVALENMWQMPFPGKCGHSTCSRPDEFVRYLDALDSEWFVACLDVGHAVLVCEDPASMAKKLGSRLGCLHVHDVDGVVDSHTLPFYGINDWNKFTKALRDMDYNGNFTYEASNFMKDLPTELYPSAMKFAADMGKYFIKKITE